MYENQEPQDDILGCFLLLAQSLLSLNTHLLLLRPTALQF